MYRLWLMWVGLLHSILFNLQESEAPLLQAIESTLDERYTKQMAEIYTVVVQFFIETIIEGYTSGSNK